MENECTKIFSGDQLHHNWFKNKCFRELLSPSTGSMWGMTMSRWYIYHSVSTMPLPDWCTGRSDAGISLSGHTSHFGSETLLPLNDQCTSQKEASYWQTGYIYQQLIVIPTSIVVMETKEFSEMSVFNLVLMWLITCKDF